MWIDFEDAYRLAQLIKRIDALQAQSRKRKAWPVTRWDALEQALDVGLRMTQRAELRERLIARLVEMLA